ncbi:MAG: spermidine synthase [Gammaproteobacteria bacterium]|nr:spermidine synthase [Gammaproteobacteria bacterium]
MASKISSLYLLLTHDKVHLILLSFLMLFVELTIIRWTGSNIYFLFFFSNFVLLASFLGIGIGFLRSKSSISLFHYSPILLSILVCLCYYFSFEYQARVNPITDNLSYHVRYFKDNVYPVWITVPVLFTLVTGLMATLADGVARAFKKFSPLEAYRLEVLGSLLGIISFSLLAFFYGRPIYWGIIISLLYLFIFMKMRSFNSISIIILQVVALSALLFTFGKESSAPNHYWSSYYKIEVQKYSKDRYVVNVNGMAQQVIESVAQRHQVKPFYFLPFQHRVEKPLDKVLVIGAGTGGDVAIALAQGAKQVDAVEIDPMLYALGKKLNPNAPYADPRVHVFINDGRAFLQQSHDQYDMIIFALTDSLMLIPGQSSLRLENYLYTMEGLTIAKDHLKANGVFTIYNYYHPRWFVDRLAQTLASIYHHSPCLETYSEKDYWATVLTISPQLGTLQCPTYWQNFGESSSPSTDNYPFIYLEQNSISILYLGTILFILFASLMAIKLSVGSYLSIRKDLDLFIMGAAFLLLETKNIINFALLFGTTWLVNALVFIGILTTVYLSIEARRFSYRLHPLLLYGLLLLSLFVSWFIPNSYLLSLDSASRFPAATLLAFTPIFIANLIFTDRFRQTEHSTTAFGVNLLGAVFGGLLEYASLLIGYQGLLIMTLILYTLAILWMRWGVNKSLVTIKS